MTRAGVLKVTIKANDIRYGNMRLRVNDGGKFQAGDLDDLQMYHDGSNSYITNATGLLTIGGSNVVPDADATRDFGSSSARWANIYSADLQLSNEGGANEVDGTWGQYTIQEGEEDLFLINRRSGKKYKFNLTEVN